MIAPFFVFLLNNNLPSPKYRLSNHSFQSESGRGGNVSASSSSSQQQVDLTLPLFRVQQGLVCVCSGSAGILSSTPLKIDLFLLHHQPIRF